MLGRAALGVDRGVGDGLGEAGGKPGGAADVERLSADLADTAGDDLADRSGVDAGAFEKGLLHLSEEVGGVHRGEPTVALADGGTDGVDDDDVGGGGGDGHRASA